MRTDLLTLEEAREVQKGKQKRAALRLSGFLVLDVALFFAFYLTSDYLTRYPGLYAVFVLVLFWGIHKSKILRFFQRKEVEGVVRYANVFVTLNKKYLSHQPGLKVQANEIRKLEIVIETEKGARIGRTVRYIKTWGDYLPGERVTLLRFIDQPIRMK